MSLLFKTISFADSPFNPMASNPEEGWVNANQNSLTLDVNTSGGDVEILLPSITSLLFGTNSGSGAITFYLNVSISVAGNGITFTPFNGDSDVDFVCGSSSGERVTAPIVGDCYKLFIAGRHQWGLFLCGGGSAPQTPPVNDII